MNRLQLPDFLKKPLSTGWHSQHNVNQVISAILGFTLLMSSNIYRNHISELLQYISAPVIKFGLIIHFMRILIYGNLKQRYGYITALLVLVLVSSVVSISGYTATYSSTNQVPISNAKELVKSLRHSTIALHGYDHYNPHLKTTSNEFCRLSYTETENRVKSGLTMLKQAGLSPSFYLSPGENITQNLRFIVSEYTNLKLMSEDEECFGPEYTWFWRNGVNAFMYNNAIQCMREKPSDSIVVHIQDWCPETKSLVSEYLQCNPNGTVRVDDIDANTSPRIIREIIRCCGESVIFAVIPVTQRQTTLYETILEQAQGVVFSLFYIAPYGYFFSWYLLERRGIALA